MACTRSAPRTRRSAARWPDLPAPVELHDAAARREMTQAQVAEKAGISTSQVSKYLRGVRPITTDELDLLCEAIGIGFERLVVEASHRTRGRHGNMGEGAAQGEFGAPVRGESGWWER
ncbi:helix-turn-helix domain-containing protein [Corynebacterium xerosis]|uniref:helix-turn-helix domain-containing protein n=1 Tax=Corynebacterium xerosis TaxID=1725 RepID=UPI00387947C2